MKNQLLLLSIFALLLCKTSVAQQTENSTDLRVVVLLMDKSEINGTLVSEDDQKVVVQTLSLGLLTFRRSEIKKIIRLDKKGRLPNPNPTRYFVGQSAFTLPKGEGYYQNIMAFVNLASIGVTDRLSATGGLEIISLASGTPILFGNLKYGIPATEKLNFAVSASYFTLVGTDFDDLNVGSLSFLGTYGTKENNFTVGAGYALASGSVSNNPLIAVGGMFRLTKKLGFLTENYILTGDGGIASFGLRFIGKKKTIDLLLFQGIFPAIDIVLGF